MSALPPFDRWAAESGLATIESTSRTIGGSRETAPISFPARLVSSIPPADGKVTITGSAEAPVGASVCRYGRTTGWRCGMIQAKNQTISFPEGTLHGLTRTSVCAEPGDGGGPFVSGTQAQGVLIGGSGNCASGGTSYFLPVDPVLAAYGLTVLAGPQ